MSMDVSAPGVGIEDLDTPDCDKIKKICYLDGFSWSDVIGWTAWNGGAIQKDVQSNGGLFPSDYFSKVTYNGSLSGFIWGDKTGWVQLSDCSSTDNQPACVAKPYCQWTANNYCDVNATQQLPEANLQSATNWGVYIDFCGLKTQAECQSALSDPYCNWDAVDNICLFDKENNPKGQPLRGHAWSQYLGWIKFGVETGDTGFEGVFTNWLTDLTPPDVNALLGNAWIPNSNSSGNIEWKDFATEKESDLNLGTSAVDYVLDAAPGYIGCSPGGKAMIIQDQGAVDLNFPGAGLVDEMVENHHCKYEIKGVLYNESDFGYFFGGDAKIRAAAAGIDINNPAPHIIDEKRAYLFTLAGSLDSKSSAVIDSGSAIADGIEAIRTSFSPKDIGGNPIVSIPFMLDGTPTADPATAVRNIYMAYGLDATDYVFDSINPLNNILVPAPLRAETTYYDYPHTNITFPASGPMSLDYTYAMGEYVFSLYGLAPTMGTKNALHLKGILMETNTQAGEALLPQVSPSMPAVNLVTKQEMDENSNLGIGKLPHSYAFEPALQVSKGELNTDFIVIGQTAQASYELTNQSSNLKLIDYALDHVIDFTDINGDIGEEVLEIKNINLNGLADVSGRTDPDSGFTRYELLHDTSGLADLQFNEFHSNFAQFHDPNYSFVTDTIDNLGEYDVNGSYYASPDDVEPYPPVTIDRTDALGFDIDTGSIGTFDFKLTPSQYIGDAIDAQVVFGIKQYIAYHTQDGILSQFAIYPAPDHISGIEVKNIGLGATGVVSGGQIFEMVGGRDLENITITSSADLRREIRRNVAQLTRNMDLTNCDAASNSLLTLPTTASDCVIVDEINKTIMAVYKDSTLTLGGTGDIVVPAGYKYSLILLDGGNLYVKDNLTYGGLNNNSLGLILLQNSQGKGGHFYIDPKPTNMVGLLYAEGSILSSPDGGNSFYYGGGANSAELRNQLYWQGSIASRNTIGGAPNKILPSGVDCTPWPDTESCSQAYDLDFTRRFAVIHSEDENVDYAATGYLLSGGGTCTNPPGISCKNGPLPTTVDLSGPNSTIDILQSKSLDTFFIQRDNRLVPAGFTNSSGLSSSSEIR